MDVQMQANVLAAPSDRPEAITAGATQVSILVLTLNEEINIDACLKSLRFSDDIVVLDSFSTDRTLEIAQRFPNVRIVQRSFDTWSKHSNWALTQIKYKNPWVYYSDADEQVTPELRDEILKVISNPAIPHSAYRLRYKNMFMGRWIRRGGLYPVWILRLYKPDRVRYEDRQVNAHPVVNGSIGELQEHFIHYSFAKGLLSWFYKHNSYSQMEAIEAIRVLRGSMWDQLRGAFNREKAIRRRSIKNLSFYVPCRSLVRFIYMYFFKLGILDGTAGLNYAVMISMYEFWIGLKVHERRDSWRKRTSDLARKLLAEDHDVPPADKTLAKPLVEVMIPTFNESDHIEEAVVNALKLGPVFVLDSISTDGTQEIARAAGATVVEHAFVNYSAQKNWGLENLPFAAEWVFILDADERITPALRREIVGKLARRPRADGYFISRQLLGMGRRIENGGLYPSWNLRLLRRGRAKYENRSVHEHVVCDGRTDYMRFEMLHLRRETISQYIGKHIRYADMESDEWLKWKLGNGRIESTASLFKDSLRARQWIRRNVWPRLPLRPLWRFVYMFFFRFGFLDGHAGWYMAQLMASYEYMISVLCKDKASKVTQAAKNA